MFRDHEARRQLIRRRAARYTERMKQATPPILGMWSVAEIDAAATLGSARPELAFTAEGHLSGSGGVNRIAGSYRYDRGTLEIGSPVSSALASTKMAGPPEAMNQEDRFVRSLDRKLSVTAQDDGSLLLQSSEHSLLLEPAPVDVVIVSRAAGPYANR